MGSTYEQVIFSKLNPRLALFPESVASIVQLSPPLIWESFPLSALEVYCTATNLALYFDFKAATSLLGSVSKLKVGVFSFGMKSKNTLGISAEVDDQLSLGITCVSSQVGSIDDFKSFVESLAGRRFLRKKTQRTQYYTDSLTGVESCVISLSTYSNTDESELSFSVVDAVFTDEIRDSLLQSSEITSSYGTGGVNNKVYVVGQSVQLAIVRKSGGLSNSWSRC